MTQAPSSQRLQPSEVGQWLVEHPDALIFDARATQHHQQGHMPGSIRLDGRNHETWLIQANKSTPIFIYCYHGQSSQTYADMFRDFGFRHVCDLIGGWDAWVRSGATLAPVNLTIPTQTGSVF